MYGEFTLIDGGGRLQTARRTYIGEVEGRNEAWLRDLLFDHPELLPISDIDPAFGPLTPLCTELRTESGPIDAAFINDHGRLTILECKLWKNPQARREVVGQILDYVSALSSWSYADLQRQVAIASRRKGNIPFEQIAARTEFAPREGQFADAVNRSLREGRVLALIAGDGVRDDVQRITETINRSATKAFTFGLVEVAIFEAPEKQLLVQPRILLKTEIISRHVVTLVANGTESALTKDVLVLEDSDAEEPAVPRTRRHLKDWWEPVLAMQFDDPEQDKPFWVATNNVVLNTPFPGIQIKAYALVSGPGMGVFLSATRRSNLELICSFIGQERTSLARELPPETEIDPQRPAIFTYRDDISDDVERRSWIIATLNTYANALRPRLRRWYEETNG